MVVVEVVEVVAEPELEYLRQIGNSSFPTVGTMVTMTVMMCRWFGIYNTCILKHTYQ
jgi:hypothetical protein